MEYALTKRYALRLNLFFSMDLQNDTAVKNANIPMYTPIHLFIHINIHMNFYALYNYNWYENFDVKLSYKYL